MLFLKVFLQLKHGLEVALSDLVPFSLQKHRKPRVRRSKGDILPLAPSSPVLQVHDEVEELHLLYFSSIAPSSDHDLDRLAEIFHFLDDFQLDGPHLFRRYDLVLHLPVVVGGFVKLNHTLPVVFPKQPLPHFAFSNFLSVHELDELWVAVHFDCVDQVVVQVFFNFTVAHSLLGQSIRAR